MVNAYTETYKEWDQSDVTQSAFDLSKVKDAAKSLDSLGKVLSEHMPDIRDNMNRAQNRSMSFFNYTLWDTSHFCEVLSDLTPDDDIRQAAKEVITEFKPDPENFIFAESHLGEDYDKCCGASVYFIPPPYRVSKYYADLEFAKECKIWPLMLQKYHEF